MTTKTEPSREMISQEQQKVVLLLQAWSETQAFKDAEALTLMEAALSLLATVAHQNPSLTAVGAGMAQALSEVLTAMAVAKTSSASGATHLH